MPRLLFVSADINDGGRRKEIIWSQLTKEGIYIRVMVNIRFRVASVAFTEGPFPLNFGGFRERSSIFAQLRGFCGLEMTQCH